VKNCVKAWDLHKISPVKIDQNNQKKRILVTKKLTKKRFQVSFPSAGEWRSG
tara:strand:+ start:791 stop:946 length:156 start_codon:yes stop_codon:yes gene_type:complete